VGDERAENYLRVLAESELRRTGDQLRRFDAAAGTDVWSRPDMSLFATVEGDRRQSPLSAVSGVIAPETADISPTPRGLNRYPGQKASPPDRWRNIEPHPNPRRAEDAPYFGTLTAQHEPGIRVVRSSTGGATVTEAHSDAWSAAHATNKRNVLPPDQAAVPATARGSL
jgi:hypothetical protein